MRFRVGDKVRLTGWNYNKEWYEHHKGRIVKVLNIHSDGDVLCEYPLGLIPEKYLAHPKEFYLKTYKNIFL